MLSIAPLQSTLQQNSIALVGFGATPSSCEPPSAVAFVASGNVVELRPQPGIAPAIRVSGKKSPKVTYIINIWIPTFIFLCFICVRSPLSSVFSSSSFICLRSFCIRCFVFFFCLRSFEVRHYVPLYEINNMDLYFFYHYPLWFSLWEGNTFNAKAGKKRYLFHNTGNLVGTR